jgi:hypothetical protein
MKRSFSLLIMSFFFLIATAFVAVDKKTPDDDNGFCEDIKKISDAFNNKEFNKLKGKAIEYESSSTDKTFISLVNLKGYISQFVHETEKETYFDAVLNEDFKNAEALKNGLRNIAKKLEKCLDIELEYGETKSFLFYTFVFDSDVELELSGNYPDEKKRYINLEISYKKK